MKMHKTKKQLEKELAEVKEDMLFYRTKIMLIDSRIRKQKETDGNVYTLYREIREILYMNKEDKKDA